MKTNKTKSILIKLIVLAILAAAAWYGYNYYKFTQLKKSDFALLSGEVSSCKMSDTKLYKYINNEGAIAFYGEHSEYIPCSNGSSIGEMCEALLAQVKCDGVVYSHASTNGADMYNKDSHSVVSSVVNGISLAKANSANTKVEEEASAPIEKDLFRNSKGHTIRLTHEKDILAGEYIYTVGNASTTGEWSVDEGSTKSRVVLYFPSLDGKEVYVVEGANSLQILDSKNKVIDTYARVTK